MCVKCCLDGELPDGRKVEILAVHIPHPAATHKQFIYTCLCVALRTTAKEVLFMKKLKTLFVDSFHELKEVKSLAMAAMLLAIAVVLGFYRLQLTESIRVGFDFIANELAGMMFGPVVGGVLGGLADVVKYIVKPMGPFFPGFTISGALGGLIYGIVLYKKPLSLKRVLIANGINAVFVNMLLNTYWLTLLYGNAYMALLPARIIKQLIMYPIDVILFFTVATVLTKANVFSMLRRPAGR